MWGFSNDESCYHVRFIYKHVNVRDYLSFKDCDDAIEYSGEDIDLIGWDIKKALDLHYNNDTCIRECLMSDQIYLDKGFDSIFDDLGGFDDDSLKNHYLKNAQMHWRRYCGLKYQEEKVIKYLYVIRCILSWNLLNQGVDPPLTIQELQAHPYAKICDSNRIAVINLINHVQSGMEIGENTIFKLNNFILKSFKSMKRIKTDSSKDFDEYDERFRQLLLTVR